MKVLHVTRDFAPRSTGGLSTAVGGMVAALAQAGVQTRVVSFDAWRPLRAAEATTPDLASALAWRPDVVHAHDPMLWPAAFALKRAAGVPAVYTAHTLQRRQRLMRGLDEPTLSELAEARALAEADRVLVPSSHAGRLLRRDYPTVASTVTRLGTQAPTTRRRREPGLVLYAGRFGDLAGTSELVIVIERVLRRDATRGAVVAGGVPQNPRADKRWRQRLQTMDRVRLVGWQSSDELAALYSSAAVLLAPARLQTLGLVTLEAMSHGVPVVATDAHPLVTHEQTALVSPAGDVDAMVDHVEQLLEDTSLAQRLAVRGETEARSYRWDRVIPDLLSAYAALEGSAR